MGGGGGGGVHSCHSRTTTKQVEQYLSSMTRGGGLSSRRNTSVEDFLSLVSSGDIPAPDRDLLVHPIFASLSVRACVRAQSATSVARPSHPPI
jgi:hypothetical protein